MSAGAPVGTRLKEGWMAIIGRFGASQTLVILALTYTFVIGPAGLISSLLRRDLLSKRWGRGDGSAWQDSESAKPDLERAKLLS